MALQLNIDGLVVNVEHKKIKHLYLKVIAPQQVRISAPKDVSLAVIQHAILQRRTWIAQRSAALAQRVTQQPSTHLAQVAWLWGSAYPLILINMAQESLVELQQQQLILQVAINSTKCPHDLLRAFYRVELQHKIATLLEKWLPIVAVELREWRIKQMKTRWGSCNISAQRIWLNLELVKYPVECLEYVVVHELVHLHERYHNKRFWGYMDQFLPDWRSRRQQLNLLQYTNW